MRPFLGQSYVARAIVRMYFNYPDLIMVIRAAGCNFVRLSCQRPRGRYSLRCCPCCGHVLSHGKSPWKITFRCSLQPMNPKESTSSFSCPMLALGLNQLTGFGCELSAKNLDAALSFWLL